MKKGFATTGILYTLLLLFLVLTLGSLKDLQSDKTILDAIKLDTVNAINEKNCGCVGVEENMDTLEKN